MQAEPALDEHLDPGRLRRAAAWARSARLNPLDIDCTTSVMLKILDGKCKMNRDEKAVIEVVYDVVRDRPGERLDTALHALIAQARATPSEAILEQVYEQRLYAEQAISRPVMKAYKAMLREQGILGNG